MWFKVEPALHLSVCLFSDSYQSEPPLYFTPAGRRGAFCSTTGSNNLTPCKASTHRNQIYHITVYVLYHILVIKLYLHL